MSDPEKSNLNGAQTNGHEATVIEEKGLEKTENTIHSAAERGHTATDKYSGLQGCISSIFKLTLSVGMEIHCFNMIQL
jgi:hypothetical protein